jgi:hypothetical protein
MNKIGIFLCGMSLIATSTVYGGEVINVEKLTKAQLDDALKLASDDTVIEYQGQNKTLAQWRSYFQEKYKVDVAKQKALAEELKAKFEAAAKALQDAQDRDVAEANARITKEFDEFRSRYTVKEP